MVVIGTTLVPLVGGPEPARIVERTTAAECRDLLSDERLALLSDEKLQTSEVSAQWIWSADRYGWGCTWKVSGGTGALVP